MYQADINLNAILGGVQVGVSFLKHSLVNTRAIQCMRSGQQLCSPASWGW